MTNIVRKKDIPNCIICSEEGVDLVPSNIDLASMDLTLQSVMSREKILKMYMDEIKDNYDYVLIDCNPSLGMLTVNALTSADSVIIPVQAEPFASDGIICICSDIFPS